MITDNSKTADFPEGDTLQTAGQLAMCFECQLVETTDFKAKAHPSSDFIGALKMTIYQI
jgi:hypothetical protein